MNAGRGAAGRVFEGELLAVLLALASVVPVAWALQAAPSSTVIEEVPWHPLGTSLALELPMGGWKASGLGSRHGAGGIRKYTRQQSLLVTRFGPKRDVHMFPYKARTTGLLDRLVKLVYGRGRRD